MGNYVCPECGRLSYPDDPCRCEQQRRLVASLEGENEALRKKANRLQQATQFLEERLSEQRTVIERQNNLMAFLGKAYNKLRNSISKVETVQQDRVEVEPKKEMRFMFCEKPGGYVVNKRAAGIMDGDPFLVGSEDPEVKEQLHEMFNGGKHDNRTLQEKIEDARKGEEEKEK